MHGSKLLFAPNVTPDTQTFPLFPPLAKAAQSGGGAA